jgi:hypothetical protein
MPRDACGITLAGSNPVGCGHRAGFIALDRVSGPSITYGSFGRDDGFSLALDASGIELTRSNPVSGAVISPSRALDGGSSLQAVIASVSLRSTAVTGHPFARRGTGPM